MIKSWLNDWLMCHLKYWIKIKMTIQDIQLGKEPLIVITDSHTNLANIRKVKGLYPNSKIVCLGDFTSLWSKAEPFNEYSIKYFIENGIQSLKGNHEEHIASCQRGGKQYIFRAIPSFGEYDISEESLNFICGLPTGFKLNWKDGYHWLCFHNRPNDLWSFTNKDTLDEHRFKQVYPVNDKTLGVIIGHQHTHFIRELGTSKLLCLNELAKSGSFLEVDGCSLHFKDLKYAESC